MEDNTAALQASINTPVTQNIPDIGVPTDISTTDLGKLQSDFEKAGSGFAQMGEALAKDVATRQQLLIGNDLGPQDGSAMGELNYDTYYEQGVAAGASAIRQEGTKVALKEGMRRAEEAAKERAKKAQEDYNRRVNEENARRAAANQAAQEQQQQQVLQQQQSAKADVQGVTVPKSTLAKYGVSSAADLAKTNPGAFEYEMKQAADQKAGITDKTWDYKGAGWYAGVDQLYREMGITGEAAKDERSGNQSQANKELWKDPKYGRRFEEIMVSRAGIDGSSYYQNRDRWVKNTTNQVQELIKTGGTIDEINRILSENKMTLEVNQMGNAEAASVAKAAQERLFNNTKRIESVLDNLSDTDADQLREIKATLEAAHEAAQGQDDAAARHVVAQAGYENGIRGIYNQAVQLISKSGLDIAPMTFGLGASRIENAGNNKYIHENPYRETITLDSATLLRETMGFTPEEIHGIHRWKNEDEAGFNRALSISRLAMTDPIQISDGSLQDAEGNRIDAGTVVFYSQAGVEQLQSYANLKEILESKPVIYDDGTGAYGWADMDGVAEAYEAYARDASSLMQTNYMYFNRPDAGTGKGAAFIIARNKDLAAGKSWERGDENEVLKYEFGGKPIRTYDDSDDIYGSWQKLTADQKNEVYTAILKRSGYNAQGEQERIKSDGNFHGVVSSDISAEDAQDLLVIMHSEMNQYDSDGNQTGMFRADSLKGSRINTAVEGGLASSQGSLNFLIGGAVGLFGVPADMINKLNGNALKEGYKSNLDRGYEIFQGTSDGGRVKWGDGAVQEQRDIREQENMFIYSGFGDYHKQHGTWTGVGELAEFAGSMLAPTVFVKVAKLGSTVAVKGLNKVGADALRTRLVNNLDITATNIAARQNIKGTSNLTIGKALRTQTPSGAGPLNGVNINSRTMDVVDTVLPSSAARAGKAEQVVDTVADGSRVMAPDEATRVRELLDRKLSPAQQLIFKNTNRAQMTAYGATETAYEASSRWTRAVASAMYNQGGQKGRQLAAELINTAHKITSNGGRFTRYDAFKIASQLHEAGNPRSLKAMNLLMQEAKWTAAYIGWDFTGEVGSHEQGRYANYLNSDGEWDWSAAGAYARDEILTDVVAGTIGYGMLGPAMRSIKANRYNRSINKWENIKANAEEGSKAWVKANQKLARTSIAMHKLANEAGAKFITEGNSVRFRDLADQASMQAAKLQVDVTKQLSIANAKALDGGADAVVKEAHTMKDTLAALDAGIGYNQMYTQMVNSLLATAKTDYNQIVTDLPTLSGLDEYASAKLMADIYRATDELPKGASLEAYREAEVNAMVANGIPAHEARKYREMYDDLGEELRTAASRREVSVDENMEYGLELRSLYHSPAGLLSPVDARIPVAHAGVDISAGVAGTLKSTLQRDSLDLKQLYYAVEHRMNNRMRPGQLKQGIQAGDAAIDEVNMAMINPVLSLHAYRNKVKSDIQVGRMRNARFRRGDVIKVVSDETFDAMAKINGGKYHRGVQASARNSESYKQLTRDVAEAMSPKLKGGKNGLSPEAIQQRAESFVNNIVNGVVSPVAIRTLLGTGAKMDNVNSFLRNHTALHVGMDEYTRIYREMSRQRAVDRFTELTGLKPTKAQLKEIDRVVHSFWKDYTPESVAKEAKKSGDKTLTAAQIAKEVLDSEHESPAKIFLGMERAQENYAREMEEMGTMLPFFQNIKWGEERLNRLAMEDSSKLMGQEFRLMDIVTNDESLQTILATASRENQKPIQDMMNDMKLVFDGSLKVGGVTRGSFEGGDLHIRVNPKIAREAPYSLKSVIAHELVHVHDALDSAKFPKEGRQRDAMRDYSRQKSEKRAMAISRMQEAEDGMNRQFDLYDKALQRQAESVQDMVMAAERLGIRMDYKKVLDEVESRAADPVMRGDSGIMYVRETEFKKSEMSGYYESLKDETVTEARATAMKGQAKIADETAQYIETSARVVEGKNSVEGNLFVTREYGNMIKTYAREGGEQYRKQGILAKLGSASNEIQQLQMAAGYSIFNAYAARQFLSAFGATLFQSPKDAFELFKVYGRASSVEATRAYITKPETSAFINAMAMRTGDSQILDAITDSVATQPSMRTGVLDDLTNNMKSAMTQARADGQYFRGLGKGTMDSIHRMVDDPTFKRFLPLLMLETQMQAYKRRAAKAGRKLDPNTFPGDEALSKQFLDEAYSEWEEFWGLHWGSKKRKGGVIKANQEASARYLSGRERGVSFMKIAGSLFFALRYRMTQFSRLANGLMDAGSRMKPSNMKRGIKPNESLLYSGLAIMTLAVAYNSFKNMGGDEENRTARISGNDPNDAYKILRDFGSIGRFNITDDLQIDPFFSVFTLQNSVMRQGMAAVNMFVPPDRRIEGVQGLPQELTSLLLSPVRTGLEVAGMPTYYGYSVWGKNAAAINPETDEPIPYSPLDNAIAMAGHFLGLDAFGFGANLTYDDKGTGASNASRGRNAAGDFIGGGGLLQHEYIDAFNSFLEGDAFGALSTALELPFRSKNAGGHAKASFNGFVMDSAESYYHEYKDKVSKGNLSAEEKEQEYKVFAEKLANIIGVWESRHNILDERPELMLTAQRTVMGFLADQWSDSEKRIVTSYRAADIDALGGFDKKSHETDEEYEERKQQVQDAYGKQLDKEYAARQVLQSIGFDVDGYDHEDRKTKVNKDRDSLNFQFRQQVEGKIEGAENLKDRYDEYRTSIKALRDAGDRDGAAALEQEYMNIYDSVVGSYINKYGSGILLRNRDFADLAAEYVIIPSADYRRYNTEYGKRNWLRDRYGVGFRNSDALITDSNYFDAYQRLIRETLRGNSSIAINKAEEMLKNVAQGRYTVTDQQYNQLINLFNKLRQNMN